ncbi:MAG: hypothetical protein J6I53_00335 [Treponema sp.]|nr:hypothetical protein [Treponema sp.]
MKKSFFLFAMIFSAFFVKPVFSSDFEVAFMPGLDFHLNDGFDNGFSGLFSLDFYPFTLRTRDKIGFSLQTEFTDIKAKTLDDTILNSFDLACTYLFRFHDRFALGGQLYGGFWKFPRVDEKQTEGQSGLLFGARVFGDYYFRPELKFGVSAGFSDFYYKPDSFAKKIDLALSVKYSFSRGVFAKNHVEIDEYEIEPIFPVFYNYYNDNPLGTMILFNDEDTKITDVTISLLIPEYMTMPKKCAFFKSLEMSEYFTVDLTAFINETILESLSEHKTEGKVILTYRALGKQIRREQTIDFTALNRNAMDWYDDKRAAAFVSIHDGAANKISRLAKSIVLKSSPQAESQNIAFAKGIFATLKAFGLSYVRDPTSPFSSGETAAIDFLQFPYQTLLYSGGDCDDLSILNCAIFESIGISTAFITIPGHILMAFDAGIKPEDATGLKTPFIIQDGIVWIPLETTLCQDNLETACKAGYNQWKKAAESNEATLYPLKDAWKIYKAVGIPESDADIELPSVEKVLKYLR